MTKLSAVFEKAAKIRLLTLDVDGVLTDGKLYISDEGQDSKAFYARDGLGIKMLQETGVIIAVITGKTSQVVEHRMRYGLGVQHVFQGQKDKVPALEQLCDTLKIGFEEVAHVGDDINDLPLFARVGLSIAVADAYPLVLDSADWHTKAGGGQGAVREVCELIMQAQGTLAEQFDFYAKR